jgi:hypothetical protein
MVDVLCELELYAPPIDNVTNTSLVMPSVMLYNVSSSIWARVKIGYVITLKSGDHVFLKSAAVRHCKDIESLLRDPTAAIIHQCENLPPVRHCVWQEITEKKDGVSLLLPSKVKTMETIELSSSDEAKVTFLRKQKLIHSPSLSPISRKPT